VLQCFAVYCSVLQCVAVCCSVLQCVAVRCSALQCVAVCCSALQCDAVRCSTLQCIAVCCKLTSACPCIQKVSKTTPKSFFTKILNCKKHPQNRLGTSVLQCVAVCCSLLQGQYVAVHRSVLQCCWKSLYCAKKHHSQCGSDMGWLRLVGSLK